MHSSLLGKIRDAGLTLPEARFLGPRVGCLPGLEGQTALVLQETTSARTPAQGTPQQRSHWSHAAGSARIQRKCSLLAVRPARATGRRGPWFQTLGSASGRQAGDARAEGGWPVSDQGGPRSISQAEDSPLPQVTTGPAGAGSRRDLQTGAWSSSAGRRLASERLFLIFVPVVLGRALLTSVPEKVCFLPLPFCASEFDSFPQAVS